MDRDEVDHMMSKKVAQLTKVIFHLNTRNDEADTHLAAVNEAHEKEVELILKDANSKVKRIAEAARAATGDQVSLQIAALKAAFENEKKEALKKVEDLKMTLAAREEKNTSVWADRLKQMGSEVLGLKQQAVQQASQFQDTLQKAEARRGAREKELTDRHATELAAERARLQADFEHRREEQQRSATEARAALEGQLEDSSRRLSACESRCQALEDELKEARRRLNATLSDGDEALRRSHEEREQLNSELQRLRQELASSREAAEQAAARAVRELEDRENQLQHWKSTAETAEDLRASLEQKAARLEQRLSVTDAELVKVRKELDDLLARSASDLGAREADALAAQRRLEEELQATRAELDALRQRLAASESSEASLQKGLQEARGHISTLDGEVESLKAKAHGLEEDAAQQRATFERALRTAQDEIKAQEALVSDLRSDVARLQKRLEEQEAEMKRRMQDLEAGGKGEVEKERQAHRSALEALEREHRRACELLREERVTEVRELTAKFEAQIRDLNDALLKKQANASDELRQQEQLVKELRQQLEALERRLCDAEAARDERAKVLEGSEAEVARLRGEMEATKLRLEADRRSSAEELRRLRERLEGEAAATATRHRQELEGLRADVARRLASAGQVGDAERQRLEAALDELRAKHKAELDALRKRFEESQGQVEDVRRQMREEVEKVRNEGVEMARRLSRDQQELIERLTKEQGEALANLRQKLTKEHKDFTDDLRKRNAQELQALKEQHAAHIAESVAAHEASVKLLCSEHSSKVAKLLDEAREAADRHAAAVAREQATANELRESLRQEVQKSTSLQQSVEESRGIVMDLQGQLRAMQLAHEETLRKMEADFSKEKRSIKEQHKSATERLLQAQLQETAGLKDQFHRARQLQDMQLKMLQARLAELQDLYDNRPSREEDVERIMQLEEEVRTKTAEIKKLLEEMHFYKLELHNREQNYNKVFGAQPSVGILNPLASKKGSGPPAAPQMRLVQQPGMGMGGIGGMGAMQLGLPPLGGLAAGASAGGASKKLQKRPSSGSLKRNEESRRSIVVE